VLLFQLNPSDEGDLAVGAHQVCVSYEPSAQARFACFDRCGGRVTQSFESTGYLVGMLLDGDDLTFGTGVAFPNGYGKLWRKRLGSKESGQPMLLWSTDVSFHFDNLSRSGDTLYFSVGALGDLSSQGIYRAPYEGGAPHRLLDWRVEGVLRGMVRVDDALYFSSDEPAHYGIYSLPLGGGEPRFLYRPDFLINALKASGRRLLWAEVIDTVPTPGGRIRSMALDGSGPRTLVESSERLTDLVADEDRVYFVTDRPSA
jgi:hypothetical protein